MRIGQKIEQFVSSYRGQVWLNFAYSWGAAVVVAGTLFKLTHLHGADIMLWLGMGTEVLVFFISAFDKPVRRENKSEVASAGTPVINQPIPAPAALQSPAPNIQMPNVQIPDIDTEAVAKNTRAVGESLERFNSQVSAMTAMYEMQLKTASSQVGTADNVSEQMKRLADQLEQLNAAYGRILQAMNSNTQVK